MSEPSLPSIRKWLAGPMDQDVSKAIERLRRAPNVQQIAVMPDVHLAADVCIGVVVATCAQRQLRLLQDWTLRERLRLASL